MTMTNLILFVALSTSIVVTVQGTPNPIDSDRIRSSRGGRDIEVIRLNASITDEWRIELLDPQGVRLRTRTTDANVTSVDLMLFIFPGGVGEKSDDQGYSSLIKTLLGIKIEAHKLRHTVTDDANYVKVEGAFTLQTDGWWAYRNDTVVLNPGYAMRFLIFKNVEGVELDRKTVPVETFVVPANAERVTP